MSLRKIALSTLSLVVVAAMSACSNSTMTPSVASVKATSDLSFVSNIKPGTFDPVTNSVFVGDVGNGKKGASITVTIKDGSAFNTKASTNGTAPKAFGDITKINLQISNGIVTFSSGLIATTFSSATKSFSFGNVPTGANYVVSVLAVEDGVGSIFASAIPSGPISVNALNQVSSGANVTCSVKLSPGVGANIGADVTAQTGDSTTGSITLS